MSAGTVGKSGVFIPEHKAPLVKESQFEWDEYDPNSMSWMVALNSCMGLFVRYNHKTGEGENSTYKASVKLVSECGKHTSMLQLGEFETLARAVEDVEYYAQQYLGQ